MSESPFKRWYSKNSTAINQKRKKAYHSDPAVREAAIKKQRDYRERNPSPSRAGASRLKLSGGSMVPAFRISEVAEEIGRSIQTIRLWEARGLIPAPTVKSAHRYYTQGQKVLLRELADLISVSRHESSEVYDAALKLKTNEIFARWAL